MFKVQKLDLLIAVYIFCICASELMGAKTVPLGKIAGFVLNGSVALLTLPLVYTINDSITEVFGKERTRSIIISGLIVVFLVLLFSLIATNLPPSARFLKSEKAYDTVLGLSARISAASLTAFAVAEFLDVLVFVRLRKALGKKGLWFRNNVSNFVSQFADTLIFMVLAFYAFDKPFANNAAFLTSLIIPYWLLKCFMSIVETPLVYLGVSWLNDEKK